MMSVPITGRAVVSSSHTGHRLEAIEGPLTLVECVPDASRCEHSPRCPVNPDWDAIQKNMIELLQAATLESLLSTRFGGNTPHGILARPEHEWFEKPN